MTNIAKLKQEGDTEKLVAILGNRRDWMLALDAAEALAQLQDERGLDYLIRALNNPNIDVRDVAREILEGLNNLQGNVALKSCLSDPTHPPSAGIAPKWLARLRSIEDALVTQSKKSIWNYGLEWIVASIIGFFLSDLVFDILLHPLVFFEDIQRSLLITPVLAYAGSTWGQVSRSELANISFELGIYQWRILYLAIEGVLIGTAQSLILRRHGIRIRAWALAIMGGWILGSIVGQEGSWPVASALIAEIGPYWEQHIMLGYTLFGLLLGTLMGLFQGVVLRRDLNQSVVSWVLLNMLVWTSAYFFSEILLDRVFWAIVGYPIFSEDGRFVLHNTVVSLSELVIGGIVPALILFRKSRDWQAMPQDKVLAS